MANLSKVNPSVLEAVAGSFVLSSEVIFPTRPVLWLESVDGVDAPDLSVAFYGIFFLGENTLSVARLARDGSIMSVETYERPNLLDRMLDTAWETYGFDVSWSAVTEFRRLAEA